MGQWTEIYVHPDATSIAAVSEILHLYEVVFF